MARSSLASEPVLKLLQPFLIVSANCGPDSSTLEPDIQKIFTKSELLKDPKHTNLFGFVLDAEGQVVHQFHGLPGSGGVLARSDYKAELTKARTKLLLPKELPAKKIEDLPGLPDLTTSSKKGAGLPAGVRLFVRQVDAMPLVEVVPMNANQWQALALPAQAKEMDAEVLKDWLVWLYPAAVRPADGESKRFQKFNGKLTLEPAGADKDRRYALLHGTVRLTKGTDNGSTFEGTIQLVITYRLDAPEVKSVRGIVAGEFVYQTTRTLRLPLKAAIESRPE